MITQLNSGYEIVVTFNIIFSRARANTTICICFVDGAVADYIIVLDCLEEA